MPAFVTRFAPSPTGLLHLGHAFSALTAWTRAERESGRFLLRIEDIDAGRCRERFVAAIFADLAWLGIRWEQRVRRQSRHLADYRAALARLEEAGLVYPCVCTRKEVAAELAAMGMAPHGSGVSRYPGTCRRNRRRAERLIAEGRTWALRLDLAAALNRLARRGREELAWMEEGAGPVPLDPALVGDVVLARKDVPTSYHLSVVVDDALQGVTHVIRGADLKEATHVHRLLQALLDLPSPVYHHHRLLLGPDGRRLAKRDGATTLHDLRLSGMTAAEVRRRLGFAPAAPVRSILSEPS
ncbi:MAG: tRNA glutamyl-Q(34) synthetase GluQRS [Rhodothalassiaceae bacterium]|nr:MAG: tRNA glutamyl-Q(34) synthetase GluQRS [Rhodothalassiaceae bacterium]